jgi:hypothetical protein
VDKRLEKDGSGTMAAKSIANRMRKCKDCCVSIQFITGKLLCRKCYKRRHGYFPDPIDPKTSQRRGLASGSRGKVDSGDKHSEGSLWVHRPDSDKGKSDSSGAGDKLQQHIQPSSENRKRRIVVLGTASLLERMGYRMAQTK